MVAALKNLKSSESRRLEKKSKQPQNAAKENKAEENLLQQAYFRLVLYETYTPLKKEEALELVKRPFMLNDRILNAEAQSDFKKNEVGFLMAAVYALEPLKLPMPIAWQDITAANRLEADIFSIERYGRGKSEHLLQPEMSRLDRLASGYLN